MRHAVCFRQRGPSAYPSAADRVSPRVTRQVSSSRVFDFTVNRNRSPFAALTCQLPEPQTLLVLVHERAIARDPFANHRQARWERQMALGAHQADRKCKTSPRHDTFLLDRSLEVARNAPSQGLWHPCSTRRGAQQLMQFCSLPSNVVAGVQSYVRIDHTPDGRCTLSQKSCKNRGSQPQLQVVIVLSQVRSCQFYTWSPRVCQQAFYPCPSGAAQVEQRPTDTAAASGRPAPRHLPEAGVTGAGAAAAGARGHRAKVGYAAQRAEGGVAVEAGAAQTGGSGRRRRAAAVAAGRQVLRQA